MEQARLCVPPTTCICPYYPRIRSFENVGNVFYVPTECLCAWARHGYRNAKVQVRQLVGSTNWSRLMSHIECICSCYRLGVPSAVVLLVPLMVFQIVQIPMIVISRIPMVKRNKLLGNIVFWLGLYAGFPLLCVAYVTYWGYCILPSSRSHSDHLSSWHLYLFTQNIPIYLESSRSSRLVTRFWRTYAQLIRKATVGHKLRSHRLPQS